MSRHALALCALAMSGSAAAECDTMNARFENESTRVVLTTIAGEAGWRIANPEVITGTLNAELQDFEPARLFPKLAASLGYQVRFQGDRVWLEPRPDNTPAHTNG